MNTPAVHIVDDDDAIRDALLWLFQSRGVNARAWNSAESMLAACTDAMRGCLLLDVRMPGMSGLELQRKLQELGIMLPVVIITGHGDVAMAVRALKAGAADFIEKPFNEQDMLDRIQKYLKQD